MSRREGRQERGEEALTLPAGDKSQGHTHSRSFGSRNSICSGVTLKKEAVSLQSKQQRVSPGHLPALPGCRSKNCPVQTGSCWVSQGEARVEGDVSLEFRMQVLGQNEGLVGGALMGAPVLSEVNRVKSLRATDPRYFRPEESCTYGGTSWPGGPRSTRFTSRTLSTFGTASTCGASFTLGRDRGQE